MHKNYIMIDIDKRMGKKKLVDICQSVFRVLIPTRNIEMNIYRSPSGRGWHVIASFQTRRPFDDWKILLIQCLCGSDIKREWSNAMRIHSGIRIWNRLFATKRYHLNGDD